MFRKLIIPIILLLLVAVCFDVCAKELFVSCGGSDDVTYENNAIDQPWRTPGKAWYNARPGDIVYFRGGTYPITETIDTKYGGYDGTEDNPIRYTNYNNEEVVLTSSLSKAIIIERNYNYVEGLTLIGDQIFFHVGYDTEATHFKLSRCAATLNQPGGQVNVGVVVFQKSRANGGIVENCIFSGPGAAEHKNTAGIFIFSTEGVVVRNCEFENMPRGIFFKHTGVDYDTGMAFTNNYFHDCGTGIASVGQYTEISNNIFVGCGILLNEGGGLIPGEPNNGGDHNNIVHNTFYNGAVNLWWTSDGDGSGCKNNTIQDNLITLRSGFHEYSAVAHDTQSDYNLYPTGHVIVENGVNYTLPAWQNHSNQDWHSVSADPVFAGGDTPLSISDFALTPASPGYGSASDGKDIGADVNNVGPSDTAPEGVYVSCGAYGPMGDDITGTGGFDKPYRTIQRGIDALRTLGPGHTLFIRGGTYTDFPVNITARGLSLVFLRDAKSWDKAYRIRSYPGEWAVLDFAQYAGEERIVGLRGWSSGGGYIEISNLEIKNIHATHSSSGISLHGGPYFLHHLYVHDNVCDIPNNLPAGIVIDNANSVIQYNCLSGNGCLDSLNANSFQLGLVGNYNDVEHLDLFDSGTNQSQVRHNNIVKYNLIDGKGIGGYSSVGIFHKRQQHLAGGQEHPSATENSIAPPENHGREHLGDKFHHNIIRNHCAVGISSQEDYTQIHNNIVLGDHSLGVGIVTASYTNDDRRSAWMVCAYNNTITGGGNAGVVHGDMLDYGDTLFSKVYIYNNILDGTGYYMDGKSGISYNFDYANEPYQWLASDDVLHLKNNFFYRPVSTESLLQVSQLAVTTEVEINRYVWASGNRVQLSHSQADSLYSGTGSGDNPLEYKLNPYYSKYTPGVDIDHPYLMDKSIPNYSAKRIPYYIGAIDPDDDAWVEGVLGLSDIDTLKNAGSEDPAWAVGSLKPVVLLDGWPSVVTTDALTVTGTAVAKSGRTIVSVELTGTGEISGEEEWTANLNLDLGENQFAVKATDDNGQSTELFFTIVREAVTITIETPTNQRVSSDIFEITGTALTSAVGTISNVTCPGLDVIPADGAFNEHAEEWKATATLSEGGNTFVFTVTDSAGATSEAAINVVYDIPSPTLTFTTENGETVTNASLIISGTASADPKRTVSNVSAPGLTVTGTTNWRTTATLVEGSNIFYFTVTDSAGEKSESYIYTVVYEPIAYDPPTIGITTRNNQTVTDASFVISGAASTDENLSVAGVTSPGLEITGTTDWRTDVTLAEGVNHYTFTVTDSAGKTAEATLTVTYAPEASLPTLTLTTPNNQTVRSAAFHITGTALAPPGRAVGRVASPGLIVKGTTNWRTDVRLTEGVNHYTFTVTDSAGKTAEATLTVTYAPKVAFPTLILTTPNNQTVAEASFHITGTASAPAGRTVAQVASPGLAVEGTTNWRADVTLSKGEKTYTFTVTDSEGEAAAATLTVTYDDSSAQSGSSSGSGCFISSLMNE